MNLCAVTYFTLTQAPTTEPSNPSTTNILRPKSKMAQRCPPGHTSVMAAHAISTDKCIHGSPVQARNTALLYYGCCAVDRKAGFKVVAMIWFFDVVEYFL